MIDRSVSNVFPYVGEMVRSELLENFGEQAIDSGYKVYTTIDSNRQRYAEEAVQEESKTMTAVMAGVVPKRMINLLTSLSHMQIPIQHKS